MNNVGFVVNYELALKSPKFSSLTKATIRELQSGTYLPLSTWLQKLSSLDLEYIVCAFDKMHDAVADETDPSDSTTDLILLNEVLLAGDGYVSAGMDDSIQMFQYFSTICICESLKRKGLVELDYSKIGYGSEYSVNSVCKLKQ